MKKNPPLSDLTTEQLVDAFARLALAQDEAIKDDDTSRYNRLFSKMQGVKKELMARPPDMRSALAVLYGHENVQVRLQAAMYTLALNREQAIEVIKAVQASGEHPYALDAGMTLRELASGQFVPQ